jgi:chaperonin GroEL
MLPPARPALSFTQTPHLVTGGDVLDRLRAGADRIVDAISPTLGPLPHVVASARATRGTSPELLDSGGAIARRITDLPDRTENVGAMLARGMIWKLHERVGDGTATAAVIFQSLLRDGLRWLAAGGSPMPLRDALEQGAQVVLDSLDGMTIPLHGAKALAGAAACVCTDRELAALLGEAFHVLGAYGTLEIRAGQRGESTLEFVQGSFWPGRLQGGDLGTSRAECDDARVLLTDLPLEEPADLVPMLRAAGAAQASGVFIVTTRVSEKVQALLGQSQKSGGIRLHAVTLTESHAGVKPSLLTDLACLTGAEPLLGAAGYTWAQVRDTHFGRARQVWADKQFFGVVGGQGEPGARGALMARLQAASQSGNDTALRDGALIRAGRLMGGAAVLTVGGDTESETESLKESARRAAASLRAALHRGVLPGAGMALLRCQPEIERRAQAAVSPDERMAWRMLGTALGAPLHTLLHNARLCTGTIMADLHGANAWAGCDVHSGRIIDLRVAGILDAAEVVRQAVHHAVHHAALALTVNAVVHRRRPPVMYTPDGGGV